MSDIAITFPVWPFLVVIALASLLTVGFGWVASRTKSGWKWPAWMLAVLFAAVAVFFVLGTFFITS